MSTTKSRPYVILSAAISIDGKIATKTGNSEFSSKEDKIRLHKLRSKVDAILIGKNTVLQDDPLLNVRYSKGKNPIRIILDSKGIIPNHSKILKKSNDIPTIIAVSKKIGKTNFSKLCNFPIDVIMVGQNTVSLKLLLKKLSEKKIQTILVPWPKAGGKLKAP